MDPKIAGMFPLTEEDINPAAGLPFLDLDDLFFELFRYLKHKLKIFQNVRSGIDGEDDARCRP